jgi:hypothetical protein
VHSLGQDYGRNLLFLTTWLGFDEAENTVEPIYEKWIDVPGMLKKHLQQLADNDCELAIAARAKVKEWESSPSKGLPGATGDTFAVSKTNGSTRVIHI